MYLIIADNFPDDTGAPGDHQYLQDVTMCQTSARPAGQNYEQSNISTSLVRGAGGQISEVTEFNYELEQSVEFPGTFVMPKPASHVPMGYSYTKPKY